MGVKHFYLWYSKRFQSCVSPATPAGGIDVLCLDMNGVFHYCAQEVFEYGVFARNTTGFSNLLNRGQVLPFRKVKMTPRNLHALYQKVCDKIESLRASICPRKALVLCVDGVAGLAKMNQQRQRRFRGALEPMNESIPQAQATVELALLPPPQGEEFHPNLFTPGTWLMHELTRYVDRFVRKMVANHPHYASLKVVFSDEKVAGEGEHKLLDYCRQHTGPSDVIAIYGLDADLVMLGMLLPRDRVYIAREASETTFEYIDVTKFGDMVTLEMNWRTHPNQPLFHRNRAIVDFVVLCFLVGNDFLPTLPSLAIMDGALELLFRLYKRIGAQHGHLTQRFQHKERLRPAVLHALFCEIAATEMDQLRHKYEQSHGTFSPDPVFLRLRGGESVCFDAMRRDFYESKGLGAIDRSVMTKEYVRGMQFVLSYYAHGMPDWTWFYPYLYAPFATDMIQHWDGSTQRTAPLFRFDQNEPVPPFLQLFLVLPHTHGQKLWPAPLQNLLVARDTTTTELWTSMQPFFPARLVLDRGGKKKDWEAIVQMTPCDLDAFRHAYGAVLTRWPLHEMEARRNRRGRPFIYHRGQNGETVSRVLHPPKANS